MENVVFAMFMMGCGHNLDVCRPIDEPTLYYEAEDECWGGLDQKARMVTDFPMAVGTCVPVSQEKLDADPVFDWFFAANGALVVQARSTTQAQASVVAETEDRLVDQQS